MPPVSLQTKTDALYFAVTTLTTVGFGDVHAQGQVARGLIIVQMVFNVVVLTRAAQTLIASRTARRSTNQENERQIVEQEIRQLALGGPMSSPVRDKSGAKVDISPARRSNAAFTRCV